jgi:phosphatidylinositol-bisphosphatase
LLRPPLFCWAVKQIQDTNELKEMKEKKRLSLTKIKPQIRNWADLTAATIQMTPSPAARPKADELMHKLYSEMDIRSGETLRILTVTYNMAGLCPSNSEFFESVFQKENIDHDIYILGSQEACKPIVQSMVSPDKTQLEKIVKEYFGISKDGNDGEFCLVNSVSLAAISIQVVIKKQYIHLLSNIQTDTLACGFAKSLPNKGAVSVSFNLGPKRLLFINCHLEAHIQNFQRRTQQYQQIKSQMVDGVA